MHICVYFNFCRANQATYTKIVTYLYHELGISFFVTITYILIRTEIYHDRLLCCLHHSSVSVLSERPENRSARTIIRNDQAEDKRRKGGSLGRQTQHDDGCRRIICMEVHTEGEAVTRTGELFVRVSQMSVSFHKGLYLKSDRSLSRYEQNNLRMFVFLNADSIFNNSLAEPQFN